ncbi:MAG: transposase [Pirellulales bacterium]
MASLRGELAGTLVEELVAQLRTHQKAENRLRKLLIQAYQALPASAHIQVETIVGIGPQTAAALVAKMVSIDRFDTPGKLVSYFGFFPEESSSGVDKQGRPLPPGALPMSRKGNDLVRAYLWMAAKSAIVYNPAIRALYRRQRAQGKRGDVALGHCVRKLLHLVYAVWKSNRPFDPEHYPWETNPTKMASSKAVQEKAVGLKPEVLLARKEVTTATPNVSRSASSVNRPRSSSPARGVDYAFLRQQITIEQVLRHLGHWDALRGNGQQLRGPCPLHPSEKPGARTFSVNVPKNIFRCFYGECHAAGNALDLWAAYYRLPLHEAAVSLAQAFGLSLNREEEPVRKRRTR